MARGWTVRYTEGRPSFNDRVSPPLPEARRPRPGTPFLCWHTGPASGRGSITRVGPVIGWVFWGRYLVRRARQSRWCGVRAAYVRGSVSGSRKAAGGDLQEALTGSDESAGHRPTVSTARRSRPKAPFLKGTPRKALGPFHQFAGGPPFRDAGRCAGPGEVWMQAPSSRPKRIPQGGRDIVWRGPPFSQASCPERMPIAGGTWSAAPAPRRAARG